MPRKPLTNYQRTVMKELRDECAPFLFFKAFCEVMDFGTSSLLPSGERWAVKWFWSRGKTKFTRLFHPHLLIPKYPKLTPAALGKSTAEELKGDLECLKS